MILKQPSAPRPTSGSRSTSPGPRLILLGAASAVAFLVLGATLSDHASYAARQLRWWLRPPETLGTASAPNVDRLYLRIEWNEMAKLERKRREALRLGVLFAGRDDFVPAWVGLNHPQDELLKAKVRLKGDWTEHLEGDRWSLRLKLKGDGRLFGMKTLSLQLPERRNGVHEWIFHQALRREGIVALRYRFVRLVLNGTDLGIYAVEEHFDSRLIEHNRFRAGPILSFDEGLFWETEAGLGAKSPGLAYESTADIRPFSRSGVEQAGPEREAFLRAAGLLAGFRDGDLSAAEVFDVEKVALHHALSDLLGAHHGLAWMNLRFYFNPVTARLEPVGFDADAGQSLQETAYHQKLGLRGLWRDEAFLRAYLAALERLSEPTYLDRLFDAIGAELREQEAVLALGTSDAARVAALSPREIYAANQAALGAFLQPLRGMRAHLASATAQSLELDAVSYVHLPVEVVALQRDGRPPLTPAGSRVLAPYRPGPVRVDRVAFEVPAGARRAWSDPSGAELEYRVTGTTRLLAAPLIRWPFPRPRTLDGDLLSGAAVAGTLPPFLKVEDDPPLWRILPGAWTLDRPLVVPSGRRLVAGPGTVLDLRRGAAVLSYSPLELTGRPEEPVVVRSTDGTGQGLLVVGAEPSTLEHVRFEGLAAPRGEGWAMTGAVTFYESPVVMRAVSFVANRDSDDALNVIRGDVTLERCRFLDTPSDAIDVDFGSGSIRSSTFERIGGDAVDTSGSAVTLRDLTFRDVADKAVSAGEMSRVRFRELRIERTELALVSKDESEILGSGVTLEGCAVAFAAFRKKPEFGPATLDVQGYEASRVEELYQLEPGSKIVLDSAEMAVNARNLRDRYYSVDDS